MNKVQAQDTLNKLNKTIEAKIVEHANELGQHNKAIIEGQLNELWKVKSALLRIVAK